MGWTGWTDWTDWTDWMDWMGWTDWTTIDIMDAIVLFFGERVDRVDDFYYLSELKDL